LGISFDFEKGLHSPRLPQIADFGMRIADCFSKDPNSFLSTAEGGLEKWGLKSEIRNLKSAIKNPNFLGEKVGVLLI
jgi:hypothetical protein